MTDPSTGPDEREYTLPSGLKVTIRSYKALRRADIHRVWAAGSDAELNQAAEREALMAVLVTSTSAPDTFPIPLTTAALEQLDGGDYIALYRLMNDGWRLANGLTVVPNPDDYQDPKAPMPESTGSVPA
ncbi:MAG TPA: hypothetical protein VN088_19045 [Nocardioides sp.]|nr:hypothetical protein [Nocardioides sp.]